MLSKSFTLIETVVAVSLLTVGTLGAFALIQKTVAFTSASSSRLTAAYLAQEGIEIVRNIRDSNYLGKKLIPPKSWDSGLTGCSDGCEADYNDTVLIPYVGSFLKIGGNLYNYDSGTDTPYQRKITIEPQGDVLNVLVEVSWQERGSPYQVPVETKLYKWR